MVHRIEVRTERNVSVEGKQIMLPSLLKCDIFIAKQTCINANLALQNTPTNQFNLAANVWRSPGIRNYQQVFEQHLMRSNFQPRKPIIAQSAAMPHRLADPQACASN